MSNKRDRAKPAAAAADHAVPAPVNPAALSLEALLQQRASLTAQHAQAIANVNAIAGALQFCEQMIARLEATPPASAGCA